MPRLVLAVFPLLLAGAAAAQEVPPTVEVALSRQAATPPSITLHHGQRYVLRLYNRSRRAMAIAAPRFFHASKVVPSRMGFIDDGGGVKLRPGRYADIILTAPDTPGAYHMPVRGFWKYHPLGEIVVD